MIVEELARETRMRHWEEMMGAARNGSPFVELSSLLCLDQVGTNVDLNSQGQG